MVQPVLPRYVRDELGGSGAEVGLAVGAFAVTAALLRPVAGRIGDRFGRRVLILGGAAVAGLSHLGYGVGRNLWVLVAMRLVTGVGEAAVFVGAATTAQDLAPPDRRGEATSYFSIAIYGGLALGPPLGEAIRHDHGTTFVWLAASAACGLAVLLALRTPRGPTLVTDPEADGLGRRRRFLQPDAIGPGIVLALGVTGYAGFATFVPLYVDQVGLDEAGTVLGVYAVIVLVIRIAGARLPDRLGSIPAGTASLVLLATGLLTMAAWRSVVGLYAGTVVFSLGQSLLYPSLFPLVVARAPERERSHAVATFTLFFDIAMGLGAVVLGVVVAVADERAAFAVAGLVCAGAVVGLRRTAAPQPTPAEAQPAPDRV